MKSHWLKRLGFVSIEVIITAALIMASGLIGVTFLGAEGAAKMSSAWEEVDELGVFGSSVVAESVELISVTANGTPGYVETTELILTLSQDIDLTVDEVVLSGATLDALVDNDDGTYILSISDITVADASDVTITLNKEGFDFGATNEAVVAVANLELGELVSLTANGISGTETTTTLTIALDKDIDLVADDIGLVGATKGTLTDNNDGTYTLSVNNITVANGANITVTLFKPGYSLTPDTKSVVINVSNYDDYGYNKTLAVNPLDINPSSEFTTTAVAGGVRITAYSGTDKTVVIPKTIGASPVVEIGSSAFASKGLTSVAIPNSVTTISNQAFYSHQLTSVIIPDSVKTIGDSAFYNYANSQLASVTIGDGVTSIGNIAFSGNVLTSLTIGNSVTSIGYDAFQNNQLTSVVIPNSVKSIGVGAFQKNLLTSVSIPDSVTSIGQRAFNDNKLPDTQAFIYARTAGGFDNTTTLVSYGGATKENVVIPSNVTTIGDYAFMQNGLISVTIPDTVTTLGKYAFGSNLLTSITIPNSITVIPEGAFANNQLVSITIPNSVTTIGAYAFDYHQLASYTVPDTVTSIGTYAFRSTTLKTLTIGSGVRTLEQFSFAGGPLTSVTFRGPVPTTLGTSIFAPGAMQTNTTLLAGSIQVPSANLAAYKAVWTKFGIQSSDRFVGY